MRLRRAPWFVLLGMGVIIVVALCFMLFLPLRITDDGSVQGCGTPFSVLTDSGSVHVSSAKEKKCEHHATLRLRNLGMVVAITGIGGLAIILLWPEDDDQDTRRLRRLPLTRRFP